MNWQVTLIVDIKDDERKITNALPPQMACFFESLSMRLRKKNIDQKALSDLFYQYLNEEEDFIRDLLTEGEKQLGHIFRN